MSVGTSDKESASSEEGKLAHNGSMIWLTVCRRIMNPPRAGSTKCCNELHAEVGRSANQRSAVFRPGRESSGSRLPRSVLRTSSRIEIEAKVGRRADQRSPIFRPRTDKQQFLLSRSALHTSNRIEIETDVGRRANQRYAIFRLRADEQRFLLPLSALGI